MEVNPDRTCWYAYNFYGIDLQWGLHRTCARHKWAKSQQGDEFNFHNHTGIQKVRESFAAGEIPKLCNDCFQGERNGGTSWRLPITHDRIHEIDNEIIQPGGGSHIEIKPSNLCNMKCMFCHQTYSSIWEKINPVEEGHCNNSLDHQKIKEEFFKWIDVNWEDIATIQILGGEPALMSENYEILEMLRTHKTGRKKQLSTTTNCFYSQARFDKYTEAIDAALANGHSMHMRYSIDGIGAPGEYIRDRLNWDIFETNFKAYYNKYKDRKKEGILIRANIAFNAMNISEIPEIYQWLNDNDIAIELHPNFLTFPAMFYVKSFGNLLKPQLSALENCKVAPHQEAHRSRMVQLTKGFINEEPNLLELRNFYNTIMDIEQNTGKVFEEIFPKNKLLMDNIRTLLDE